MLPKDMNDTSRLHPESSPKGREDRTWAGHSDPQCHRSDGHRHPQFRRPFGLRRLGC